MITTMQKRWRTGIVILALILVLQLLIGATAAGAASPAYHVVQWGENLTSIAYQYGTSPWDIASANGIWNPDLVYVGQVLYIPHPWVVPGGPGCGVPCGTPSYVPRPVPAPCGSPCGTPVYVPRPVPAPCGSPCGTPVYAPRPVPAPCGSPCGTPVYVPRPAPAPCGSPCGGAVYVVHPGDNLTWIAMRFGTSVWAIAQANGLANPNVIYAGQRLVIPV